MPKRYIHEVRLDENQSMVFVAICSTFMIYCIKMYIQHFIYNALNNLVSNLKEMNRMPEASRYVQTLQYLKDSLIRLDGDEQLLLSL